MMTPVMPNYNRIPLSFTHGEGAWLIEADGRRFLDFGAGIAVNGLGPCPSPACCGPEGSQADKLWHTSNLYTVPEQEAPGAGFWSTIPLPTRSVTAIQAPRLGNWL